MKRAKVYISLLFVLAFVFPVVFQSVHVVMHHWQALSAHHCCQHHHQEEDNDRKSIHLPIGVKSSCPILDFEYASFNRTADFKLNAVSYKFIDLVKYEIQKKCIQEPYPGYFAQRSSVCFVSSIIFFWSLSIFQRPDFLQSRFK